MALSRDEKIAVIVAVGLVAAVVGYELYLTLYVPSGLNQPASGTPAALQKNTAVTTKENAATSASENGTGNNTPTGTGTGGGGGSYNELMVEVNAYDPDVAGLETSTSFYTLVSQGVSSTRQNLALNALEASIKNGAAKPPYTANQIVGLLTPYGFGAQEMNYMAAQWQNRS